MDRYVRVYSCMVPRRVPCAGTVWDTACAVQYFGVEPAIRRARCPKNSRVVFVLSLFCLRACVRASSTVLSYCSYQHEGASFVFQTVGTKTHAYESIFCTYVILHTNALLLSMTQYPKPCYSSSITVAKHNPLSQPLPRPSFLSLQRVRESQ